jgi:hypothetical protein
MNYWQIRIRWISLFILGVFMISSVLEICVGDSMWMINGGSFFIISFFEELFSPSVSYAWVKDVFLIPVTIILWLPLLVLGIHPQVWEIILWRNAICVYLAISIVYYVSAICMAVYLEYFFVYK